MTMSNSDTQSNVERTLRNLLPIMNKEDIKQMLALLSEFPVKVVKTPESGLIMVHARDCFDVGFFLGEILVTTAEVDYFGIQGHATIMGDDPLKAVLAATLNALTRSAQTDALNELSPLIEFYTQKYEHLQQQEDQLTAATKVSFESMVKEA
ncbi:MAG: phosphonate C-P lyase system protein PhnG [Deltaproteobacteria bacterium]|nr:phosphonate C-P lyase system protein PhnG [Deltaproteobacteria bacterium]